MIRKPRISLVLCVKNGLPYLREAVESVRAQTYKRFELVVQDGASTDGTTEYLRSLHGVPGLRVVSEPDGGIGDAYNRAFRRCQGAFIGTIDADNLLEPGALALVAKTLAKQPELAALYGAVRMIDADGTPLSTFLPAEFNAARLMTCELVPPFSTAFFSRATAGSGLHIDEQLETCADFDLWLRLSDRPILRLESVLGSTRLSEKSMTRDASRYDAFCRDKIAAMDRHLATAPGVGVTRAQAVAGIYLWAAESVLELEGRGDRFQRYLHLAEEQDPTSPRLAACRVREHV